MKFKDSIDSKIGLTDDEMREIYARVQELPPDHPVRVGLETFWHRIQITRIAILLVLIILLTASSNGWIHL